MARRSKHRLMNDINVVPYIDVMLVLLIIFMVTAPMINHGQIELPQIGKSLATPVLPLEIIIKANGDLYLRDRTKTSVEQKLNNPELVETIKQKQSENPEQAVVIAADKNVRYEEVIKVMDALQQHQVQKVGLLTQQK
ncbi:MAG: protein TolR [Pseudomonadota bacterium]